MHSPRPTLAELRRASFHHHCRLGLRFSLTAARHWQVEHHRLPGLAQHSSVLPAADFLSSPSAQQPQPPCSPKGTEADLLNLLTECCRSKPHRASSEDPTSASSLLALIMSKNLSPRGRHHPLSTANEVLACIHLILHHCHCLAARTAWDTAPATPLLLPPSSSSPC